MDHFYFPSTDGENTNGVKLNVHLKNTNSVKIHLKKPLLSAFSPAHASCSSGKFVGGSISTLRSPVSNPLYFKIHMILTDVTPVKISLVRGCKSGSTKDIVADLG